MKQKDLRLSKPHSTALVVLFLSLSSLAWAFTANAQSSLGTAFTYQGRLDVDGVPVTNLFDFRFRLFDASNEGYEIGSPVEVPNVAVTGGLFVVKLDFGSAFSGSARWLETRVSLASSNDFTTLSPRVELTATPNALFASNAARAANAALATSVATGAVTSASLANGALQRQHFGDGLRNTLDAADGSPPNAVYVDFVGNVGIGTNVPHARLHLAGNLKIDGANTLEFGAGVAPKQIDAGKIGYGTFTANTLDVVGAGLDNQRRIKFWNEGGAEFTGNVGLGTVNPANRLSVIGNVDATGRLGLGTTNPASRLHIQDNVWPTAKIESSSTVGTWLQLKNTGGGEEWRFISTGSANGEGQGHLVISRAAGGGTVQVPATLDANVVEANLVDANVVEANLVEASRLHVQDSTWPTATTIESSSSAGTWLQLKNTGGGGEWRFISTGSGNGEGQGHLVISRAGGGGTVQVPGTLGANVVEIYGGSDIAEPFNINESRINQSPKIEPGLVVTIDPDNPGELRVATSAYDRTVAGIISGAGGVNPGMMLTQKGSIADGKHPVALTGRVYCYVDADAAGTIAPGDLLTTSDTPGHAMRVTDPAKAAGAILGKAMTSLEKGRGLVLVLVTLQ